MNLHLESLIPNQTRYQFLADVSLWLTESPDYKKALGNISKQATSILGDWCAIHLTNGKGRASIIANENPVHINKLIEGRIKTVVNTLESRIQSDLTCPVACSSLCVPIRVKDTCWGTVTFVAAKTLYTTQDLSFVENLARRIACALELSRALNEIKAAKSRVEADKAYLEEHLSFLEKSNEELGQFASVAAHDLQAPLRTTVCFLQLLNQKCKERLTPEERIYLKHALNGVNAMKELVEGLLSYARVESRSNDLHPLDCNKILLQVQDNLNVVITETKAQIVWQELPLVLGNRAALLQLFQNLLSNSIKYCKANPRINITAAPQGHQWLFSVQDNGIGIEPQFSKKIFNLFERLHSRSEYPGCGIGLATCKKIVERHGGRIWVDSAPGQGSCFYFTLPSAHNPN